MAKLSGSDTLDIKDIQFILAPGGLGARASCCARYSPPAAFLKATTAPEGRGLRRSRMELGQEWKELYPLMAALHKEGRYDEMVLWVEDGEAKQGGTKGKRKATKSSGRPKKTSKVAAAAAAAQADAAEGKEGEQSGGEEQAVEGVDGNVVA
jgi:hypothetical protein